MARGERVTIDASGRVKFLADSRAVAEPDGQPASFGGCDLNLPCGALIGRFGTTGPVFFVGKHFTSPMQSTDGELELGINDFDFTDNSGTFTAKVSPGPTVGAVGGLGSSGAGTPTSSATATTPSRPNSSLPNSIAAGLVAIGALVGWVLGRALDRLPSWSAGVYIVGRDRPRPLPERDAVDLKTGGFELHMSFDAETNRPAFHQGEAVAATSRRPRRTRTTASEPALPALPATPIHVFDAGEDGAVVVRVADTTWGAYLVERVPIAEVTAALGGSGSVLAARALKLTVADA